MHTALILASKTRSDVLIKRSRHNQGDVRLGAPYLLPDNAHPGAPAHEQLAAAAIGHRDGCQLDRTELIRCGVELAAGHPMREEWLPAAWQAKALIRIRAFNTSPPIDIHSSKDAHGQSGVDIELGHTPGMRMRMAERFSKQTCHQGWNSSKEARYPRSYWMKPAIR